MNMISHSPDKADQKSKTQRDTRRKTKPPVHPLIRGPGGGYLLRQAKTELDLRQIRSHEQDGQEHHNGGFLQGIGAGRDGW